MVVICMKNSFKNNALSIIVNTVLFVSTTLVSFMFYGEMQNFCEANAIMSSDLTVINKISQSLQIKEFLYPVMFVVSFLVCCFIFKKLFDLKKAECKTEKELQIFKIKTFVKVCLVTLFLMTFFYCVVTFVLNLILGI